MQVNMLEAKTQLSKLVDAALRGEDVVIANRGKPVVRLVKAVQPVRRKAGAWVGLVSEQEIEDAFSPEAEQEFARIWLESLSQPVEPTRKGSRASAAANAAPARRTTKPRGR
jgi:prevent-host-death family protein